MGGVLLILFFIIGFIVYIWLIRLPIKWAKKRGVSGRKRLYIGIASFFVVSALFFGKNLISYTAFTYYCKNEAGLTIYKTLDEWKKENPKVWKTLRKVNHFRDYKDKDKYPDVDLTKAFDGKLYRVSWNGNQRIISYSRYEYQFWGTVEKTAYLFFDNKTQEILAKYQYFKWQNTWDTTPDKDGWRGAPLLGGEICKPERDKFSDYEYSFNNLNLTKEEQKNE